jgi:hypothetical protein
VQISNRNPGQGEPGMASCLTMALKYSPKPCLAAIAIALRWMV